MKIAIAVGILALSYAAFAAAPVPVSSPAEIETKMANWSETSKNAARTMLGKYGEPASADKTGFLWLRNGDWKRSVVLPVGVVHNFPSLHVDVLEQTVDYQYPLDKHAELARFDGSVTVRRTRGELSSSCDQEKMNYLALNLAHEIARGKRSADDARSFLAQTMRTDAAGKQSPYTTRLLFETGNLVNEPDRAYGSPPE